MPLPSYKEIIDLIKKGATVEAQEQVNYPRQSRGLEIISPSKGLRRLLCSLARSVHITLCNLRDDFA